VARPQSQSAASARSPDIQNRKDMGMNVNRKWGLRDGALHSVGPLRFRFTGAGENGPEGECSVQTEECSFQISWMDGEAIAFCIMPTEELWGAYESDKEQQKLSGEERGWLRLELTSEEERLAGATSWAGEAFQINRLVMNAEEGEIIRRRAAGRTTDYRRSAFVRQAGYAKEATRASFIRASVSLARRHVPTLPDGWEQEAIARWQAADDVDKHVRESD